MMRLLCCLLFFVLWGQGQAAGLPDTLQRVKPGVVAVGTFMAVRQQQDRLSGTGFVVGRGNHAVTNSHVVPRELDSGRRETVAIYLPTKGNRVQRRTAEEVKRDIVHDLCLLRFTGPALHPLRLGSDADVREGQPHAFTGFPILNALWLYPVTHAGIVSSITPLAFAPDFGRKMDAKLLAKTIRPFTGFHLDATAYPGNSGSPLYDTATGRIIGIINMVFVKGKKENAITNPSGITYAIPVSHARKLLDKLGLKP